MLTQLLCGAPGSGAAPADCITLEKQPISDNDLFFVIWSGECTVYVDNELLHRCEAGALFGEMEMMDDVATELTIKVESETAVIYALDRKTYKQIMSGAFDRKNWRHEVFLGQHPLLKKLQKKEMMRLAHAMRLGPSGLCIPLIFFNVVT